MILSWSLVEVPRYAFYLAALVTGDATKKTPYPLFWLRYSLFAVLYPTGIVGEMTVFLAAAGDLNFFNSPLRAYYGYVLPLVYFFGSPFMIFNMVSNRKNAFKKRFAKPPPPPHGLCWPPVDAKGGSTRSSTETNKAIVAAALQVVNPQLAQQALECRKWRFQYVKYLEALVQGQCQSPELALQAAQAGLDKAYELFEFVEGDDAVSFATKMAGKADSPYFTAKVTGKSQAPVQSLQIPYQDGVLQGDAIRNQVQAWVEYGTIEASAGKAILETLDHPKWLQSFRQRHFVLLGAGSAMGPLKVLLALGANVVAIDLDRPGIWKNLLKLADDSPGTLTFPCKMDPTNLDRQAICAQAGCNLFTDTPRIRDWLLDLYPGQAFTVGCYAYLDGALHVQVSLAMDAICKDLSEKRPQTSLAYLCTPTDLHLIPKEAHDAAQAHYNDFKGRLYCK